MFSWLFVESEPARLPRIHDVSVPQISLIDGESRAVLRAKLVNPTQRNAACPTQERARKHHVAARTGTVAFTDSSAETLFNVAGSDIYQIETSQLAPKKNATLPEA